MSLPREGADAGAIVCSGVASADLFELAAPYGRSGSLVKEEIASHVGACPACLERLQSVHRTIYGVAERADSGVVTVYTSEGAREKAGERANALYSGYPVDVQVIHRLPAPVHRFGADRLRATFGRVTLRSIRPSVKAALLAAAVIPLAILLVISSQTASATNIRQISGAVKGVENLHVIRYGEDATRPVQEMWIERATGRVAVKSPAEQTLYNVKTRRIEARYTREGVTKDVPLEPLEYTGLQQLVDSILGFALAGIPLDTELQRLPPEAVADAEDGSEVYELTWEEKSFGEMVPRYRLRVCLDPVRRLPRKTQTLWWTPDDPQWRLKSTRLFEYPGRHATDPAIKDMLTAR